MLGLCKTESNICTDSQSVMVRVAFLFVLIVANCAAAGAATRSGGVSVDDIVSRTLIPSFSLAPDGRYVAFFTVQALPRPNIYQARLYVRSMSKPARPFLVAAYFLKPDEAYDADSHSLQVTASQYVWSPDSRRLLYTTHHGNHMELHMERVSEKRDQAILIGHRHIVINHPLSQGTGWTVTTFDDLGDPVPSERQRPKDFALRMRDSYRFYEPFTNPSFDPAVLRRSWNVKWAAPEPVPLADKTVFRDWNHPDEYVWNGLLEVHRHASLPFEHSFRPPRVHKERPPIELEADIRPEKTILWLRSGDTVRKIGEQDAALVPYNAESTDKTRATYISRDGETAALLKLTNLVPDELVKVDLKTGLMAPLFSPNESFRSKTEGIRVRFMPIDVAGGHLCGRLFLPANPGTKPLPLVFTTYLATPTFNLSDEVPILALLTSGIAVFALDARAVNQIGHNGDFKPELQRLELPREAMEWVIRKLAAEGIIDPTRCGVSGLSYGAEIAMHAYWRSQMFRAVSATTGNSAEPIWFVMGGLGFAQSLTDRGFTDPIDGPSLPWTELSTGLHASASLPPLLWQSPDRERSMCIEPWFRLRRAGARVEWLEYPGEGHVKRSPANLWWVQQRNLEWFRFWLLGPDAHPVLPEEYDRWRNMQRDWEAARANARDHSVHVP